MSADTVSQVERDLIWDSNRKSTSICSQCPFKEEKCMLAGVPTRAPYNLFFLFESPDQGCLDTGQPIAGNILRLIKKIKKAVNPLLAGDSLDVSVAFSIGAVYKKTPPLPATVACSKFLATKMRDAADIVKYRAEEQGVPDPINVIVPFGTGACKSLNLSGASIDKMRGKPQSAGFSGVRYTAVPTLSLRHLYVNPNWINQIIIDVKIALKVLFENYTPSSIERLSRQYVLPTTLAEVKDVCGEIVSYTDAKKQPDPDRWPIAVDTETTGLLPHAKNQRILMASVAWDDRLATSITLDHKDVPYDPREAWKHFLRVLSCNKPKILHNMKFDWKWFTYVSKVPVKNIWWDTMLAEHFLNENAKGFYSLKTLALSYALHYAGYETQLNRLLLTANKGKNIGKIVQYDSALKEGVLAGHEVLQDLEEQYVHAYFEWSLSKKKSKEREEANKIKNSLRNKIIRLYKKADMPPPPTASLSVATDYSDSEGLFETVPLDILARYAAVDADLTRIICKQQRRILTREGKRKTGPSLADANHVMKTLYLPGSYTLGRMEQRGIRVDQKGIDQYEKEILECRDEYKRRLEDLLCVEADTFNFRSPNDLGKIFIEVLGLDYDSLLKTESGQISTKAEALKSLQEKNAGNQVGDFCHNLLVFRSANMAVGTFLKNLRRLSSLDGRIHCGFHLNGTATGRLSSSKPNMQNQPPFMCRETYKGSDGKILDELEGWSIKRLFVPSNDKYVIFDVDVSAAEIRVLTAYIGEDPLTDAVKAGLDVPSFITSRVFGKKIWKEYMLNQPLTGSGPNDVYDEEKVYAWIEEHREGNADITLLRVACKRVLYGTLYGAGPFTIAEQIYGGLSGDEDERDRQIQFASDVQQMFFEMSPGTKRYVQKTGHEAITQGHVKSMFRRYRRFPMASTDDRKMMGKAKRESTNFKIQSAASDLVLSQLIEIEEQIELIGGRVMLTVHDSIVGEIRKDSIMELPAFFDKWIVARVKEKFPWLPVEYKYGLAVGINYKDLVAMDKILSGDLSEKEQAICKEMGLHV